MATNRKQIIFTLIGLILASIGGYFLAPKIFSGGGTPPVPIVVSGGTAQPSSTEDTYKMDVQLSNGKEQPQSAATIPLAASEALSSAETDALLARLPALPPSAQTDFNMPAEVLPPPQPGNKIEDTFPPRDVAPPAVAPDSGELKVTRFAPEGEIPIAPFVSVTFSQPMVPLGTLKDLAAADVPLKIEPPLEGTWRWLGTKTLTFQYDSKLIDRLPKATEYRATVPAGTKSATGGVLTSAVSWTFKTPPPKIISTYPDPSPQPTNPLFFILFDQRINPADVLAHTQVNADGTIVGAVLATQAEIDANERVSQLTKDAQEGRWLAFRATQELPKESNITVTVAAGTPSAEGKLTTIEAQTFSFQTYAPLRIEEYTCGYSDQCPPLTPFNIRFNNPLDTKIFTESMLSVAPEIAGVSANVYGTSIEISGATKGQTTYTITVSGKIQDMFGQQLGQDTRLQFKVGKAEPVLVNTGQNFITLDPSAAKPVYSVYAINYSKLNLKVYAVTPNDWTLFKEYLQNWQRSDAPPPMGGVLVANKSISLDIPTDTLSQVDIDLSPYLAGKTYGHFVVIVEPPAGFFESDSDKWRRYSQTIITWAQVTQIGLDAFNDHSEMIAWATDLKNGAPLAGVNVTANKGGVSKLTDVNGVSKFPIPEGATYLIAQRGADQAILPRSAYAWEDGGWTASAPLDELRWYVFDDRKMYKPGEEVHIKGWMRKIGGTQNGDVGLSSANAVSYQITDPQGNALGDGRADVNSLGGFDFAFTLPKNTNLGSAQISLNAEGALGNIGSVQYYHQFQIQEFRRPEFEVTARNETTGPYFSGDHAALAVAAKYYAGGGLPNADVTWQVTTSPSTYSPPKWEDFTFGNWRPWFMYDIGFLPYPPNGGDVQSQTFTGKTDATGTHYLGLDFKAQGDPAKDPQPYSVVAQGTVMDVNRQAWSASTTLLIHPADVYIGLRSAAYFVERGTPIKVDFIVADIDGKPIENRPIEITAGRLQWKTRNGNWVEEIADTQVCSATSTAQPATCEFQTPLGGTYRITAIVTDEKGRKNQSQFTRWVSGGEQPPARKVEQEKVTLIPDKETYQPGDTAKILVQSPFSPAEGILTVARSGILYETRFKINNGTATLNVPIEEKHIPNLSLQVDLVGSAPRTDDKGEKVAGIPPRPAFASGQLNLKIPPQARTLSVQASPDQAALAPGSETTLTVTVKDAHGLPVSDSEVAVVVVDEAVLALTNYQMQDPLGVFYTDRYSYLTSLYSRTSIILADPQALARQAQQQQPAAMLDGMAAGAVQATAMAAPFTMTAAMSEAPRMAGESANDKSTSQPATPIAVRSDFNPLANFSPAARTGFDGVAHIQIKLPDNLTRYRIMVVAVDNGGKRFGSGDSNLTARLPLMARPSAPRFLNFGDKFELPVVLQNQTDQPMTVDVAVRASNLEVSGGQRVTVPANDRVEVRFPASTQRAGDVRIQFAATSGNFADAATIDLPVYTPATSEAFATYGVIDNGAIAQPVQYPRDVFPQYGGLQINTSSTALQALTDAVIYLVKYPYECSEQLASRILGIASLRDVLTAFKADGLPAPAVLEATVADDVAKLQGIQNYDGGFPYWRRGFESSPFNTVHVAHALIVAQKKGFAVPADMIQNSLNYLRDIETHYPEWYSQDTRWTLSAYALYVRNLNGDRDAGKASRLLNEAGIDKLSMDAIGWLWTVIDDPAQLDAIRLLVANRVVETAGAANFTTAYSDQTYLLLSSDRRTDAILLDALIEDNPQSDLIPKLVKGLQAHQTKGRWNNTQENVFVLLALDRYFKTYEATTPDFVAQFWLGNTYAGSAEFRGRTTDIHETLIPMTYVLKETDAGGGTQDLILNKDGAGRLYYRLALNYAPTNLKLDPLDMGFVIVRSYEGVDNPDDVTQSADGVWHIKAGARVRVKIQMVADNRRYHVALVDPLPAGLEIVNPELAVSQNPPQEQSPQPVHRFDWWFRPWYEHQNLRDNRAEAFTSLLWEGVYDYTYIVRATTPGTYIVPPAKAEEMYSPEVFGRSGSDWVEVR